MIGTWYLKLDTEHLTLVRHTKTPDGESRGLEVFSVVEESACRMYIIREGWFWEEAAFSQISYLG
jgi:hypothetical protein